MRSTLAWTLVGFVLAAVAPAQRAEPGEPVPDFTFAEFLNGDGRQKLSDFRGETVLAVTFADVRGGLDAALRAMKLHKELADRGLVVILGHVEAGGTRGSGSSGRDLGAWCLWRFPDWDARVCSELRPRWNWKGKGTPPLYAVVGADGKLVAAASIRTNPKKMEQAVRRALAIQVRGWGATKEESSMRSRLYGKDDLAGAWMMASSSLKSEVRRAYERKKAAVQWWLARGQWVRAERATKRLAKAVTGVATWEQEVRVLGRRFETEEGRRELALDKKLCKLMKPLTRRSPRKGADAAFRRLARRASGTTVGRRAGLLAERVALAADF